LQEKAASKFAADVGFARDGASVTAKSAHGHD